MAAKTFNVKTPTIRIGGAPVRSVRISGSSLRNLSPAELSLLNYKIPGDTELIKQFPEGIFDRNWPYREANRIVAAYYPQIERLDLQQRQEVIKYILNEKVREQQANIDRYKTMVAERDKFIQQRDKQLANIEKQQEKEIAAQEKLDAKEFSAQARAAERVDRAIEREFPIIPGEKRTPEDTARMEARYNELNKKYLEQELMKVGLEPETQEYKKVPYGSKGSLSEWVKNNQNLPILQAYQQFANDPNYTYSEEDFKQYPNLGKALAMVARGHTAPFEGNSVSVKHLTDPNWQGTAERVYLSYKPSNKTVDEMIEEMRAREGKSVSNLPRAITPSSDSQYTKEYINRADRISNYVNRNAEAGEWARNLFSGTSPEEDLAILGGVDTSLIEYPAWQKQIIDTAGAIGSGLYDSFRQIGNKVWDSLTNW